MSRLPARLAWLVVAAAACSSGNRGRATAVEREQRVTADNDARSRWFGTLYSLQRLLATADARRLDVIGPLQVMLCLPADAALSRLGALAQARMAQTGAERVGTRLRRTVDSEAAVTRWVEATPRGAADDVTREALIAVEETLVVERVAAAGRVALTLPSTRVAVPEPRCEPGATEGSQGADGAAVQAQVAIVLRRSAAQALMFQRAVALAGEMRAQMQALSAGAAGALAAEFRAADPALSGVATRATMHLHEAARTEQWALALLTPEGETPPEEVPDVAPEDNDPENRAPPAEGRDGTMPITVQPAVAAPDGGT